MASLSSVVNGTPTPRVAKTIGYIGLGNADYPLASTLTHADYHLLVRDADPSRAEKFATENINSTAVNPNDPAAFKDVDVLVTMLPHGEIVRDVLIGPQGVAQAMKEGSVVIDTSSSSPFHTRETSSLLRAANPGVSLIDSPVTQEYAFALARGDATLMVGCSNSAALDLALPVLRTMGKHVFVMGELGAGHAMKTLNNYTSAASIVGLCDALIAGQKFGLDPAMMVDVMNVGTGVNFSTKESFRTDGLTRKFASGYQLGLLLKDMRIARSLINEMGPHSALSDLIVETFADADMVAGPGACHTQVIQGWEKRAGMQLKKSKID